MERIEFTGYTEKEKLSIAEQFILPRQLKAAGLLKSAITFTQPAVARVISDYTRESGLRNLERELADICRKIALLCLNPDGREQVAEIDPDTIARLLGPRKFFREAAETKAQVGIATGLVWAETGGEIISVETAMMPGSGTLILTGSLGEVLQESAQAVLSFIRSRTREFNIVDNFFRDTDIHIHFPSGAIPKDGPSAGITIFAALLSLLTRRPANRDVALTGEMTLSGRVLPISGIREKLLAARRAGVRRVLLPLANREEVEALSTDVTEGLELLLVANAAEVVDLVLEAREYLLQP
jgi:ATP-dependent Lon protease